MIESYKPPNALAYLPDDLLTKVFLNLRLRDLQSCLTTCDHWSSLLQNPLFLHEWLHIHHPAIYKTCEVLASAPRFYYQKNFLAAEKLRLKICEIRFTQIKIFMVCRIIFGFSLPLLLWNLKSTFHNVYVIVFTRKNLLRLQYIARLALRIISQF